MTTDIQFIEKPQWVSWDLVHEVLWEAHSKNRENGVIMSYPSLSGEELKDMVGDHGKLFVAIDGKNVVGTLALIVKSGKKWYNSGEYGYLCFGAVLSEYSGKGIYRSLYQLAETTAKQMNLSVLTRDTNENNARMLKITKQEGYHFVEYRIHKDHSSIVRAKWLEDCPFSDKYIQRRYIISKKLAKIQYKPGKVERSGIISFFCRGIEKVLDKVL